MRRFCARTALEVVGEPGRDALREGLQVARPAAARKAHVAAVRRLPERYARAHFARARQRRDGAHALAGALAGLLDIAQQGVAAERDADRRDRARVALAEAAEHPADLFVVARVIRARRAVDLARAAAKVRHREAPAAPA